MERDTTANPEQHERDTHLPLYHHSRLLQHVRYDVVSQEKTDEEAFGPAYAWVERELGFYPLFLAVGTTEEDLHTTGYQDQFRKGADSQDQNEEENRVLFSFNDMPRGGVFMDDMYWHIVLNSQHKNYNITDHEKSTIFHPSWSTPDWMEYGKYHPGFVLFIVPELDLRKADAIWTRDNETTRRLEQMGFDRVQARELRTRR